MVNVPGGERGMRGGEVVLDLARRLGGELGVHAGADGGEDSVELHGQVSDRSPGSVDVAGSAGWSASAVRTAAMVSARWSGSMT